jgi:toxin HigB-1
LTSVNLTAYSTLEWVYGFGIGDCASFMSAGVTDTSTRTNVTKIRRILALLDAASRPQSLDLPGLRLHALKGDLKGFWSVSISGNWRIVFRFEEGEARDVDLVDYH